MRWRRVLLTLCAGIGLVWSALWLPGLVDALTADCAAAASEISDPCAVGQASFAAFHLGIWFVGVVPLAVLVWRTRATRGT